MKLIVKFNLILLSVFTVGLGIASWVSYEVTRENAYLQVKDQAALFMQQALAVRSYTVNEVRPLLKATSSEKFFPQTVPAYSATQVSNTIRKKRPEFSYKEAVVNPTNPRNAAAGWEKGVVARFISNPLLSEQEGEITVNNKSLFYFAFPIKIKNPACLSCHSKPDAAPKSMLALYGRENGFGWHENEVVGAQLVTVPFSLPRELALRSFWNFLISIFAIFLALFVVLNILISKMIVHPITKMTNLADEISHGNLYASELEFKGKDEISSLAQSFNRMMRGSLAMMKIIKKKKMTEKKQQNFE